MKNVLFLALVLGLTVGAVEPQAREGRKTTPLKIYSGGIGAGAMLDLDSEADAFSGQLFRLSFVNMWQFREHVALFADVNWFGPGRNFGADAGFDFLLSSSSLKPFLGFGIGAHHFESDEGSFSTDFGPSATLHIGFLLDITETVQVRMRLPYYVVLNEANNHGAGLDIAVMFTSPLSRVRRIHY
ncbi:hypothetical protein CHISP_0114 [Chitinispirillum alkaliphilum]|nr:hypothetical protein CHISP_0114 [Chitinispirillum alkaliphilum]